MLSSVQSDTNQRMPKPISIIPWKQFPREGPCADVTRRMLPWNFSYNEKL